MNTNNLFDSVYEDLYNGTFCINDYIFEGATYDTMVTVLTADTKSIKKSYKDAKDAFKQGDYNKTIKLINETKKGYESLKKKLQGIDDTIGGNICGWIVGSGLLTLVFDVKAGGIIGFGHGVVPAVAKLTLGNPYAGFKNVALNVIIDGVPKDLTQLLNAWVVASNIAIYRTVANNAIKVVKLLINVHTMKKNGETPTWNYVKADIITSIQFNIDACDEIIERCNTLKTS